MKAIVVFPSKGVNEKLNPAPQGDQNIEAAFYLRKRKLGAMLIERPFPNFRYLETDILQTFCIIEGTALTNKRIDKNPII